jgi:circadian clock protein KaiB
VSSSAELPSDAPAQLAASEEDETSGKYILRLYITGMTSRSARTIENLRVFCEKHLAGRYELQVIDVYQQPELASREQIVAVPTLIKQLPLPLRRLIGDMSDEERVLVGLNILPNH